MMLKSILVISLVCLTSLAVNGAPLKIVNVSAPAINCVFSSTCSVRVKDTKEEFALSGGGKGVLQTRTFKGAKGSAADGLYAFQYRLDLSGAMGTKASCVDWISLSFGPVVSNLNFGGDSAPDHIFVISSGGTGTVGLASATQAQDTIRFTLRAPVCSATATNEGASTFFWGLVSTSDPENMTALIHETGRATHVVKARSPM